MIVVMLAWALGGVADLEAFFARHDQNRDGKISKEELKDDVLFAALDRDQNGGLYLREVRQVAKYLSPELIARLEDPREKWQRVLDGANPAAYDRDADGALQPRELAAMLFDQIDVDGSGALDPDEAKLLPFLLDSGPADRRKRLTGTELVIPRDALLELDANHDGRITPDEFPWPRPVLLPPLVVRDLMDYWKSVDKDGDGKIEKRELPNRADLFRAFDAKTQGFIKFDDVKNARGEDLFDTARRCDDRFLARYDLDGDGVVVPGEFPGPRSFFERLDRNGDGKYDRADRGDARDKASVVPSPKAEKKWARG